MNNRFRKGSKVIVYGFGKINRKFYQNIPAIVLERDPYYKDYYLKFKDGTEDWVSADNLRKPYERKKEIGGYI